MIADIIRALIQRVFRDKIVGGLVIVAILGMFFIGKSDGPKEGGGHRFISQDGHEGGGEAGEGAPAGSPEAQPQGAGGQGAQDMGQPQGQPQGQSHQQSGHGGGEKHSKGFLGIDFGSLFGGHHDDHDAAQQSTDIGLTQPQGQGQGAAGQTNAMHAGGQQQAQMPQQQAQPPQDPNALDPQLAIKFTRWWLTQALDYSVQAAANHKKAMAYAKPQVAKTFSQSFYTPEVMQGVANGTLAGSFEPATVQAVAVNPDKSVVVTVIGTLSMQSSGSQPMSQSLVMDFGVAKDSSGVRMTGFFNKTITQPPAPAAEASAPIQAAPPEPVGY